MAQRHIAKTYQMVFERMLPFWHELSVRKQVCLLYIRFRYNATDEDRDAFVAAIKDWRKRDKRIGRHRTLLERLARKLYKQFNKIQAMAPSRAAAAEWGKWSAENQVGVHDPAKKEEISRKKSEAQRANSAEDNNNSTRDWVVITPEGRRIRIRNLTKFCKDNGLNVWRMSVSAKYPEQRHHSKGWRAERWHEGLKHFQDWRGSTLVEGEEPEGEED